MPQISNSDIIKALSGCVDPYTIRGRYSNDSYALADKKQRSVRNIVHVSEDSTMCPVTSVILADAQLRIERLQGIGNVNIELVWEPAWSGSPCV